ncbi:Hypothetical protein NTJ_09880 [Nesidiocoris tenuis]|uniref:Uncharacterized protein n=1 Tax=Nesidiocoris tenuis TaxID=355587 RepID=A0ABN7B1M3_9HEMI|nr:Hypothetical protein NTJ_09880 [Nesidiocoris tenuis]
MCELWEDNTGKSFEREDQSGGKIRERMWVRMGGRGRTVVGRSVPNCWGRQATNEVQRNKVNKVYMVGLMANSAKEERPK